VVADVSTGYHHDAINHQMAVIERLGRESKAYMTMLRTDSQLLTKDTIMGQGPRYNGRTVNAKSLDFLDAVFLMPSGAGNLTDQQKADPLAFIRDDGKGILVGHAATVGYYEWPEFHDLIGGVMNGEFAEESTVIVEDPNFSRGRCLWACALQVLRAAPDTQRTLLAREGARHSAPRSR